VNYPPFYFNSGMIGIQNIDRQECAELGLLDDATEDVTGMELDEFGDSAQADFSGEDSGFMEMIVNILGRSVKLMKGVLTPA
jgi:hypothetical protein